MNLCIHNLDPRTCSTCLWYAGRRPEKIDKNDKPPATDDGAFRWRGSTRSNALVVKYADHAAIPATVKLGVSKRGLGEVHDRRTRVRER